MTLIWIVIVAVAAWAAWVAYEINKPNSCSGDCVQGRFCNCKQTTPEPEPDNWPFPTQQKP